MSTAAAAATSAEDETGEARRAGFSPVASPLLVAKQNILACSRGDAPRVNTTKTEAMTIIQHNNGGTPMEDDESPINLSSNNQANSNEVVTLSMAPQTNFAGLSAKMRLKKQRLEAASDSQNMEHSALHRLAEAAERKQEEENMLEIPFKLRTEDFHQHTPSPDSAIHSSVSGCHSPSQSPVQSRQVSGVSSPFTLSRNNSDASQHLSSPHDSPVQMRHNEADFRHGAGISRQQLINSPCPVCGDKISGFHYGIFSCESCKGFFKRTVQNKKNYQCLRGASCPISIATRKKCPACRFNKCLVTGMKLEAIREDRTRGGRSTYQCSYTLPTPVGNLATNATNPLGPASVSLPTVPLPPSQEDEDLEDDDEDDEDDERRAGVPRLIQEIMDVEHLWFSTRAHGEAPTELASEESMVQTLTNMADRRLFKLVKWCKSLPLFKNILIDDQISLLINAWCELLVFSCCYRSKDTPGVIRISHDKSISLAAARQMGIDKWIEKMLYFADQLRRLKVDGYEYVSMKVIVLLTSDASGLKEPSQVGDSQEKVVQALQHYTSTHYPEMPSKFAELLLRMPELHRLCQGCKEMLSPRPPCGDLPGFNLLMELLRGDH